MNRERRNRGSKDGSSRQNVSATNTLCDEMISIGDAIVAGVSRAVTEKGDDVTTLASPPAVNQGSTRPSASSGSVGEFIANLRKRKEHPS